MADVTLYEIIDRAGCEIQRYVYNDGNEQN